MKNRLQKVHQFSKHISKGLEVIAASLIAIMLLISFAQIVMRYIFNSPFTWSDELVRYLFIWAIFLGASLAMAKGVHLTAGIYITQRLPGSVKKIVEYLIAACTFAVLIVLIWKGVELTQVTKHRLSVALRIPMKYVWSSVPINAVLMLFFFLLSLVDKYVGSPAQQRPQQEEQG